MKRIQLIERILEKTNFNSYLEIGCHKGKTFFPVQAKYKYAVDPAFHPIFLQEALIHFFKLSKKSKNRYFRLKSDDFFEKKGPFLNKRNKIDIVLIDGLHTFETSLNDVVNCLKYLNNDGIIIMHDCLPPNKAAALPTKDFPKGDEIKNIEGWTGAWCGDVWKSIVYLRANHSDTLDVCVINTDNGLGIVRPRKKMPNNKLIINPEKFADIDKLNYDHLVKDTEHLLNLKNVEFAETIIQEASLNKKVGLEYKK